MATVLGLRFLIETVLLIFGLDNYFEIVGINAIYLDDVMFEISDTTDIGEVPQIKIIDIGDGTLERCKLIITVLL